MSEWDSQSLHQERLASHPEELHRNELWMLSLFIRFLRCHLDNWLMFFFLLWNISPRISRYLTSLMFTLDDNMHSMSWPSCCEQQLVITAIINPSVNAKGRQVLSSFQKKYIFLLYGMLHLSSTNHLGLLSAVILQVGKNVIPGLELEKQLSSQIWERR